MIQWVVERVRQVRGFTRVVVATDHPEIERAVLAAGGEVMITRPEHPSGTDRVWEVAQADECAEFIFNIQGDEPLINPHYLEDAIAFLKNHHEIADIVTLKAPVHTSDEIEDPNVVKVVTTADNQALYFSRAPIPYVRQPGDAASRMAHTYKHVGIYGFKRSALSRFVQLPVSPLENLEKLEQLRALEAGMTIYALPVPEAPRGGWIPRPLFWQSGPLSKSIIAALGGDSHAS